MVLFGQVVVGPPGSGKTTYCHGMNMFVAELGRKCHIVNLDFANDILPYTPSVDVRDLVSLQVFIFLSIHLINYIRYMYFILC